MHREGLQTFGSAQVDMQPSPTPQASQQAAALAQSSLAQVCRQGEVGEGSTELSSEIELTW